MTAPRSGADVKESDLYPPLKRYLESQGYEVKGEVLDCDVLAVRDGEEPVVVELKRTLNLRLILQAVERLSLTTSVYVGVSSESPALQKNRAPMLRMLRMLGLGLVAIAPAHDRVDVLLDPGPYRGPRVSKPRRQRLLGEFARRVGDPNVGGSERRGGVMTAYRQRAVAIAIHLAAEGPTKASRVASALDQPTARDVLYRNVYGWFERVGTGVYGLSPRGERELPQWRDEAADP
jgi:hypothetical protein